MTRTTDEWIGKTDDTKAPPRVRRRIFDAHKGICFLTKREIDTELAPSLPRCRLCRLYADHACTHPLDEGCHEVITMNIQYGGSADGDDGNELTALWKRYYLCRACVDAIKKAKV